MPNRSTVLRIPPTNTIMILLGHSSFLPGMEAKNVLLFFLFLGTISSRVFATGEDSTSRSGYFITRENKRFVGYVVKRFVSASFMSCSQSCLRNPWCSSTNFKVSSEMDGKGTCELSKHGSSLINENTKLNEERGYILNAEG